LLFNFVSRKEQKKCQEETAFAIQFLFPNGLPLPSYNPLKINENQIINSLRVWKRGNENLYRHGVSSIDIIPVIYFLEGISADFWMKLRLLGLWLPGDFRYYFVGPKQIGTRYPDCRSGRPGLSIRPC
jgi:hypothetical protein